MLHRIRPLVLLAALVAGCSNPERTRDRYDLYWTRPARADRAGVHLMDTEEAVVEKLGSPSIGITQDVAGQRWTEWTYSRRVSAWEPPDVDDVGVRAPSNPDVRRIQDDVCLTFLDGRLRVIEDFGTGAVETNLVGPEAEAWERLQREVPGEE